MQHLTEDQFFEIYKPVAKQDGSLTLEHGETLDADLQNVWSLVDGDDGGAYAIPGYHIVNVFGYTVTEEKWDSEDIEAVWFEPSEDEEDEDEEDEEDIEFFDRHDPETYGGYDL